MKVPSMDQSWIELAGKISLYSYFLLVAVALVWMLTRTTLRSRGPAFGDGLVRFLLEYVGNVNMEGHGSESERTDRRRNREARVLMDRVKQEMINRAVPSSDTEQLMEELREAIRAEGQGPAG